MYTFNSILILALRVPPGEVPEQNQESVLCMTQSLSLPINKTQNFATLVRWKVSKDLGYGKLELWGMHPHR